MTRGLIYGLRHSTVPRSVSRMGVHYTLQVFRELHSRRFSSCQTVNPEDGPREKPTPFVLTGTRTRPLSHHLPLVPTPLLCPGSTPVPEITPNTGYSQGGGRGTQRMGRVTRTGRNPNGRNQSRRTTGRRTWCTRNHRS